jgi:hypothetical protein
VISRRRSPRSPPPLAPAPLQPACARRRGTPFPVARPLCDTRRGPQPAIRMPHPSAPTPPHPCAEGLQPGFRVVINDGPQGCECPRQEEADRQIEINKRALWRWQWAGCVDLISAPGIVGWACTSRLRHGSWPQGNAATTIPSTAVPAAPPLPLDICARRPECVPPAPPHHGRPPADVAAGVKGSRNPPSNSGMSGLRALYCVT